MEKDDLILKIQEIEKLIPQDGTKWTPYLCESFYITTIQFVRNYIGKDTEFYLILQKEFENKATDGYSKRVWISKKVLKSIKDYLNLDLEIARTEKYNLKVDIINDFLIQANELANDKKYHPAAAAILLGAALEEFLKKLAEENSIDISAIKQTIDPVSTALYNSKIISKQDLKDITSWAGIRNDATHGNFEEVNDRKRILNALEGVNLFMRKHIK